MIMETPKHILVDLSKVNRKSKFLEQISLIGKEPDAAPFDEVGMIKKRGVAVEVMEIDEVQKNYQDTSHFKDGHHVIFAWLKETGHQIIKQQ